MNSSIHSSGSQSGVTAAMLEPSPATKHEAVSCVSVCAICGVSPTKIVGDHRVCTDPNCESNTGRQSEHNFHGGTN
jgi:hypothetical protein